MPARTTTDYEDPVIAPKVVAALEDALREEDEIQVDAAALVPDVFTKKPKSA